MSTQVLCPKSVGMLARDHYRKKKEAVSGRRYSPNNRHDTKDVWGAVGQACINAGANPTEWIDAQFYYCNFKGGPFANALHGAHALRCYENYRREVSHVKAPPAQENGKPAEIDFGLAQTLVDDMKYLIHFAHFMLEVKTGSTRLEGNPKARALLGDFLFNIEPDIRCAMAYCRNVEWVEVFEKFGAEARKLLCSRPDRLECFRALGYDIDKLFQTPKPQTS